MLGTELANYSRSLPICSTLVRAPHRGDAYGPHIGSGRGSGIFVPTPPLFWARNRRTILRIGWREAPHLAFDETLIVDMSKETSLTEERLAMGVAAMGAVKPRFLIRP